MAIVLIDLTNEQRLKVYEYALQEIESDLLKFEGRPDDYPKGTVTGLCYAFIRGLSKLVPMARTEDLDEKFLQGTFPEIFIKYRPADYDSSVRMYWWPLTREGLEKRKNIIITEMVNLRSITAPTPWDYNKPKPK